MKGLRARVCWGMLGIFAVAMLSQLVPLVGQLLLWPPILLVTLAAALRFAKANGFFRMELRADFRRYWSCIPSVWLCYLAIFIGCVPGALLMLGAPYLDTVQTQLWDTKYAVYIDLYDKGLLFLGLVGCPLISLLGYCYTLGRWGLAYYIVADRPDLKADAALSLSSELSKGCRFKLGLAMLALSLVALSGLLFFGMGILVTGFWTAASGASIYRNLVSQHDLKTSDPGLAQAVEQGLL